MDPKHLATLRIHDACHGMSTEEINMIASEADVVHVAAGELIHTAGQQVDAIHMVISGRLQMVAKTPSGERRILRYISAGDQFGALMLFAEDDLPIDIVVDEKAVLLRLSKESAGRLADEIPLLRSNLLRKLGMAVSDTMRWRRKRIVSKVVTCFHADHGSRQRLWDVISQLDDIGEKVSILSDRSVSESQRSSIHCASILNEMGDYMDEHEVHALLKTVPELDRVFVVVDKSCPETQLRRLIELSDVVFCLSSTRDADAAIRSLQDQIEQAPSMRTKTNLIWLLGDGEQVAPLRPELPDLINQSFKIPGWDSPKASQRGIERLVHFLRGVNIGLALSGGAAHGMAHLGVLRALEEVGIVVDRIAGTSAGTLTGVLYAAGFTPQWGVQAFTHDLQPKRFYKWFPKGDGLYLLDKYRSHSWDPMLRKYLQDWRLEQLPIAVTTVTTDLISARAVTRTTGDAVHSILESINLPVLSPPICRDGMLLVDGGIVNNLPADLLAQQGCNFVIGVDVAANVEHRVSDNVPGMPTEEMKTPGIVTTMLRCLRVQAHNMSAVGANPADVLIAPDVSDFEPTAFAKTSEMADIGYHATKQSVPRIREILCKLDADLFRE